jgi:hypothetical protein
MYNKYCYEIIHRLSGARYPSPYRKPGAAFSLKPALTVIHSERDIRLSAGAVQV